jgi:hypothetical protein
MSKSQDTAERPEPVLPERAARPDGVERHIVQLLTEASERDGSAPRAILERVAHHYGLLVSLGTGPDLTTYTA